MRGECVATIACEPSAGTRASSAIRPRQEVKESAASGSSKRYKPLSTTRVFSTWMNAWPWLLACRSTPPKRSAHRPSAPTAVNSSCIFSARRKNPPFPPPRVPMRRSARSRPESSAEGLAVAINETFRRSARTWPAHAAPIAIAGAFQGSVEPIARWKVEGSWWDRPVVREYWKVVLNNSLLCELYHDLTIRAWFVDRVYD